VEAFTLGHTESYDRDIAREEIWKAVGGWIWRTQLEAEVFLASEKFAATLRDRALYSVYVLEIPSWREATAFSPDPSDGVYRLKIDVPIKRKAA
jgi:hypothetical protein